MPSRASQASQPPRPHSQNSKSRPQPSITTYTPVDSYSGSQAAPSPFSSSALSARRRPAQLLPSGGSQWPQGTSQRGLPSYRHTSQSLPNASLLPSFASSRHLPLPVPSSPTSFGSDPRGFSSYSAYAPPFGVRQPQQEPSRSYGFAGPSSSSSPPEGLGRRRSLSLSTGSWGTSSGSGSGGFSEGHRSDSSSLSSIKSFSSSASGSSSLDRAGSWGSTSAGGSMKAWDGGYSAGGAYSSIGGRLPAYDTPSSYPYSSFSALPFSSVDSSTPQLPPSAAFPPFHSSHLSSTSTLTPAVATHATAGTSAEEARRAKRTVFTAAELDLLQSAWDNEDYYPSMELVGKIMEQTGLTRTQVRNWFANRRQRAVGEEKRKITEMGNTLTPGAAP